MEKNRIIEVCDRIIEWCFYALLAFVTFSITLVEVTSAVMIAAWFVKKLTDRDWKALDSVPIKMLCLFWLWNIFSCANSDYFKESYRGIFKVLQYGMIFVIAATSLRGEKALKRSFFTIVVVTAITCMNGFFQYFMGADLIRQRPLIPKDFMHRISSSFVHPNDFGVYLLVAGVIFISFLLSRNTRFKIKLWLCLPLALSMVCLFLTKSRGAWLSFVAAFLVLGALKTKRVLAIFLAILLVVFIMLPYTAQERIFSLTDFKDGTTRERLMLWKGTINMVKEHPFLGFGVNTYSRNFPKYKPPEYPDVRYTHNSYLHMASEIGIIGALLFLVFLITILIYSLKSIFLMTDTRGKDLAMGVFAGLVGFSMNCVVDTHLYSVNLAVFFYLLLGFCFALSCHAHEK